MKQKIEHGLGQFLLTLVITLFALIILVGYSFASFYAVAKKNAITIGENSVAEESEKLNNFLLEGLDTMKVTGIVVDYMLADGSTLDKIEHFLLSESDAYSVMFGREVEGIYGVFCGQYLDGSGWKPEEDYVPQERPWYLAALDGEGQPMIASPYMDALTNSIKISVCQLLSDGESVVSLDMAMDEMQDFAQDMQIDGKGYGFIMDGKGMIVAHSDETQKGKNYLSDKEVQNTDLEKLVNEIYDADGETFTMEIDGRECMIFSKVVQDSWYVVKVVDSGEFFQQVHASLVRSIIISIILFLVVGYFCTTAYQNRRRALQYAQELKEYQLTLEERVAEQTVQIREQSQKMIRIQEDVIEGMAALIESRDAYTGLHVKNTKKYASMIITYILKHHLYSDEVDEEYVERLRNAAALHDVGKILISDTILNKPGKLTDEEFVIMRSHTTLGEGIVERILGESSSDKKLVQMTKNVVLYHHEKWNGSGYPEGLKGTQIPLCARIMAVADVFDALVTQRVYKKAMSREKALSILKELSGTQFDPEIVDIFFHIQDQVIEYQEQIQKNQENGTS